MNHLMDDNDEACQHHNTPINENVAWVEILAAVIYQLRIYQFPIYSLRIYSERQYLYDKD